MYPTVKEVKLNAYAHRDKIRSYVRIRIGDSIDKLYSIIPYPIDLSCVGTYNKNAQIELMEIPWFILSEEIQSLVDSELERLERI